MPLESTALFHRKKYLTSYAWISQPVYFFKWIKYFGATKKKKKKLTFHSISVDVTPNTHLNNRLSSIIEENLLITLLSSDHNN